MNIIVIIICCFFLISLKPIPNINTCEQVEKISAVYATKMRKKGLLSYGNGAFLRGGVERISLFLETSDLVDIDKARRIYVDVAEGFIDEINQDKVIRPYLHDYPCTNLNINLIIDFTDISQKRPPKGYVAVVYVANGMIFYSTYDHVNDELVKVFKEPYEEALKIVREESKQQLLSIK